MDQRSSWEKAGYDWAAHDAREKAFIDRLSAAKDFDVKVVLSRDYFTGEQAIAISSGVAADDPFLYSPDYLLRMQVEAL